MTYKTVRERQLAMQACVEFLNRLPNASKPLRFVATALNSYLSGKEARLDVAFGMELGRGKHEREKNESDFAMIENRVREELDAYFHNKKPGTWKNAAAMAGIEPKEYREIYKRYKRDALEKLATEIAVTDILDVKEGA